LGPMIRQFGTAVDVSSWMEMIRAEKSHFTVLTAASGEREKWNYETEAKHVRSD